MHRVRVLISILGLDQHEVGAVAVSRILRDAGMEVIYTGRFNMPAMIVETSIQEAVDLIGLSCHSWEYLYFVPQLMKLLTEQKAEIPVIVGGSIITPGDRVKLAEMGVAASFGPSSSAKEIVETIRRLAAGGYAASSTKALPAEETHESVRMDEIGFDVPTGKFRNEMP
ncbi:MAG: cobalamin B12-binding domain-containing protein [Desulfomonilaceae bacterium]